METTGYLNFASTKNISKNLEAANYSYHRQTSRWWNFSNYGIIRFLPVLLTLAIVSIADGALAARVGDRGAEVTNIQRCLKQLGVYNGPVTGYFGSQTEAAVRRFQSQNRIQAIGVVGPQTSQALNSRCQARSVSPSSGNGLLRAGSNGTDVLRLQQNLRLLGFYNGPVNGNFGTLTQQAVIRFQNAYRLTPDGIAGGRTLAAINSQVLARTQPIVQPIVNPVGIGDEYPDALNVGDRGPFVTKLQDDLRTLNYFTGNSTGYFGPVTRDAVARFQRDRGLFANGIADRQTLLTLTDALQRISNGSGGNNACSQVSGNICQGERSQRVTLVQQRLREWGFYPGNVDGFYGQDTRDAVLQFQRYSGLNGTGIVDFQTWQALRLTNNNNSTTGSVNSPAKNSYVVAIPINRNDILNRVRQFVPQAQPATSRKGDFVNAGAFRDRNDAEKLTRQLRDRGFDARVEYID